MRAKGNGGKGIEVRHTRACASREGKRCSCDPSYRAVVFDAVTGRKLTKTFLDPAAAKEWRQKMVDAVRAGKMRASQPVTLREAALRWLEDAEAGVLPNRSGDIYKPSTLRGYRETIEKRLLPRLGSARLRDLRRKDVQAFADELTREKLSGTREKLSAQTVRNALLPLRAIYRRALALGDVEVNPTLGLTLPASRSEPRRAVEPREAVKLLAAIPDLRDRAIVAVAFYAGLRRGEIMAVRWEDVELGSSVLHVRRSFDPKAGVMVSPKSRAGVRTVPIPTVLHDHVAAWRATCSWQEGLAFGETAAQAFHYDAHRARVKKAWKTAGLPPILLHEARHSYVSWLAESGVAADVVQRAAGHSSITVTMDRYRHVLEKTTARTGPMLQGWLDATLDEDAKQESSGVEEDSH